MKFDDVKKLILNLTSDIDVSKNNTTFKRKIDTGDIKGVIDISMTKESKIPKEDFTSDKIIKDYRYRILKLDRYYKNPAMRINQLNIQSLKMYAKLADILEHKLNEDGVTVARLVSKLRRESYNYDIYYTLYKIAENSVLNHYNPLSNKSSEKSLNILEEVTSNEISNIIKNQAEILSNNLPNADKDTLEYFNLNEDGSVSMWWDPRGELREKYSFTIKEQIAINQISKKNNILWKNKAVYEILIDMYLATIRHIIDCPDISTNRLINTIKPYNQSKIILECILTYTEKNLREIFTFFSSVSYLDARLRLTDFDDGILLYQIDKFQEEYLNELPKNKIYEIYLDYFDKHPKKYNDFTKFIENLEIDKKINLINEFMKNDGFNKSIDYLIRNSSDETRLIGLVFAYKNNFVKNSYEKYLYDYIYPDNINEFIRLVNDNEVSIDLLDEISKLRKKKSKKIDIDIEKVKDSKENLKSTVDMVSSFFKDNLEDEEIISDEPKPDTDNPYESILRQILDNGFIDKSELEKYANDMSMTFNPYLEKINDSLYDDIGDQTLLLEDNKVIIDEFYVDMVKEILDGK